MLEHHANASTHRAKCVFVKAGDFAPLDMNRTRIGLFQTVDATDKCGLARAAATDDA
ncbi:hypothetical protein B989_02207 [Brucella sp. 56/94]|nr:hypothetical protein DK65_2691 [Brucella pinnipedialis]ENR07354.1 hypothetical protein C068_02935 [Brucella sp. UK38/05]ENR12394.1 hypothetical protein C066_02573 [Brucella sp. UK5/01]ENS99474.1 hypothetical protein B989_02207 [Brucella sp. 56/94]ENT06800.1 hypothetical protein C983_02122 [Brucella sp. F23/97]ENT08817.1 hypothetical protein C001_02271 [Brucella sp. F5/06]ENT13415.1 hypothetical protein C067_02530 [Brucella sp. F8/99]ENT15179.1 hypothetical protein B998_02259 [Brucella sp.